ncbi:MAG: hypothetical protein FWE67_04800 [Planctomycetaceae bacterium]|nr:hypothetical protein [Planctomycetaceae bacterium]
MKLPLENRLVEIVLSLLIIMYGLRLIIPTDMSIIVQIQHGWFPAFRELPYQIGIPLYIIAGCLLIVFFARIVQMVGYIATGEKIRSKRSWLLGEILAVPCILYAFVLFLFVFLAGTQVVVFCFYEQGLFVGIKGLAIFSMLLFYLAVAALILFRARSIAAWLLRIVKD